jgi:hypothetical protein
LTRQSNDRFAEQIKLSCTAEAPGEMCVLEAIDNNSVGSKMLDACMGEGLLQN